MATSDTEGNFIKFANFISQQIKKVGSFFVFCFSAFKFYFIIGVIGLVLLYFAEHTPQKYAEIVKEFTIDHILRDLGISFVVAFIVIMTIESRQRHEMDNMIKGFIENTNAHVFKTLFDTEFQADKWNFIRESIMKQQFYRINTTIVYTIKLSDGSPTRFGMRTVILESDLTQTVRNITNKRVKYPVRSIVEKSPSTREAIDVDEYSAVEMFIGGKKLTVKEMAAADDEWTDSDLFRRFQHVIWLEPFEEVSVRIISKINNKLIADTEVWRSIFSCDGLEFIINYPPELRVLAASIHSNEPQFIHQSSTMIMGRIKAPLLPFNGILFWWTPCNEPPCEQTPLAPPLKADADPAGETAKPQEVEQASDAVSEPLAS